MGLKFGSGTKKKMNDTNVKKKFKNLGNLPESIQIKTFQVNLKVSQNYQKKFNNK